MRRIQVDITFEYDETDAVTAQRSAEDLAKILRLDWERHGFVVTLGAYGDV